MEEFVMGQGTTYIEFPFSAIEEDNAADFGMGLPVGRGQISPDAPPGNIAGSNYPDPLVVPNNLTPQPQAANPYGTGEDATNRPVPGL